MQIYCKRVVKPVKLIVLINFRFIESFSEINLKIFNCYIIIVLFCDALYIHE